MLLNLNSIIEKYNCKINGVLHIGAHEGQEYQTYTQNKIYPIIFIEALPNIFNKLISNVGPECICINKAIGNFDGKVNMHVDEVNKGKSSSVLKPKLHLHQYPDIQFTQNIEVDINKIDSLEIPMCNFINMDIQGYELEALRGSEKYLKNVDYIMIEVNRAEVYEKCAQIEDIDLFLSKYNLIRVETDWTGQIWGDAFYIRK